MIISATKEQILMIAARAVNASLPVEMGHIHFIDKIYYPHDFKMSLEEPLFLDYVDGRQVKIHFKKTDIGWEINDNAIYDRSPDPEYQSWVHKYPTYEDLFDGIVDMPYITPNEFLEWLEERVNPDIPYPNIPCDEIKMKLQHISTEKRIPDGFVEFTAILGSKMLVSRDKIVSVKPDTINNSDGCFIVVGVEHTIHVKETYIDILRMLEVW